MKKIILGFILGVIISGTVGVIASTIISSTNVTYQNKTVNMALDELYDSVNLLKTKGDAEATQILTGKKVIVKGTEITGTMANRGNLNWNPSSSTSYTVPAGYYSGGTLNSSGAYNTGYSAGVSAADNRANASSVNYQTGFNNGKYGIGWCDAKRTSNGTDGVITIPVTGTYNLYADHVNDYNGTASGQIYVNGSLYARWNVGAGSGYTYNRNVSLNAGTTLIFKDGGTFGCFIVKRIA